MRLDQALLEDIAALARRDGFPWSFSGYGAKHCGGCGRVGASSDALRLGVAWSRFLKIKRASAQNGKRHVLYFSEVTHKLPSPHIASVYRMCRRIQSLARTLRTPTLFLIYRDITRSYISICYKFYTVRRAQGEQPKRYEL
jgi:hypothetical protein